VSTTASTKGGVDACEEESRQEEDGKEGQEARGPEEIVRVRT
jgi:hypothetical protein